MRSRPIPASPADAAPVRRVARTSSSAGVREGASPGVRCAAGRPNAATVVTRPTVVSSGVRWREMGDWFEGGGGGEVRCRMRIEKNGDPIVTLPVNGTSSV